MSCHSVILFNYLQNILNRINSIDITSAQIAYYVPGVARSISAILDFVSTLIEIPIIFGLHAGDSTVIIALNHSLIQFS